MLSDTDNTVTLESMTRSVQKYRNCPLPPKSVSPMAAKQKLKANVHTSTAILRFTHSTYEDRSVDMGGTRQQAFASLTGNLDKSVLYYIFYIKSLYRGLSRIYAAVCTACSLRAPPDRRCQGDLVPRLQIQRGRRGVQGHTKACTRMTPLRRSMDVAHTPSSLGSSQRCRQRGRAI